MARLSPRRAYAIGLLRARAKARKEMHTLAQSYDDELVALQDQFRELALAHHRQCRDAAITEAQIERATRPGMLLH